MEEKKELTTLEEKQLRATELSFEISRLHKILSLRQSEFNKLDTEIYKMMKAKDYEQESTSEDNK